MARPLIRATAITAYIKNGDILEKVAVIFPFYLVFSKIHFAKTASPLFST
jgi:hypothetical protein